MTDKFDRLANSILEFRKVTFEGAKLTDNRKDLTFMGVNTEYLAIVPDTDGASFVVWPLTTGQSKVTNYVKHKCDSNVLSIDFDPFHSSRVIVACESGKFKQWHLNLDSPQVCDPVADYEIAGSSTPVQTLFHPSASDVAFLVNGKCVACVNVGDGQIIREMEQDLGEIISASLNIDGTKIACTYADEKLRVHSTTDMSVLYVAKIPSKRSSVVYLTGLQDDFIAVSLKADNRRYVKVYKADCSGRYTEKTPDESVVSSFHGDTSTSPKKFSMMYDPDINVILLSTAGEVMVYFVHLLEGGSICESGVIKSHPATTDPVKSLIAAPKLAVNPADKELTRLYKAGRIGVEMFSFKHPRKANTFEKTLYPPTCSCEPAMTLEEYMGGKVAMPKRVDMEPLFQEYKKNSGVGRTYSLIGSAGDRLSTSPLSFGSQSNLSSSSLAEFEELKKRVDAIEERLSKLERA